MPDKNSNYLDPTLMEQFAYVLYASSEQLFQLILETDISILKTLLKNPNLTDDHLLALLKRRDLPEVLPKLIHQKRKTNLSHKLVLALVKNPKTAGNLVRNLLPELRLFELVDLCFVPGATQDQRLAAERAIVLRLPTVATGNKITLARRATAAVVGEILKEGDARTFETCLNNPYLAEASVFQFLNGPLATATTISMVARHHRWQQRPNLRLTILKKSQTPAIWFTLWLPKLAPGILNQILANPRLSSRQKSLVRDELKSRHSAR